MVYVNFWSHPVFVVVSYQEFLSDLPSKGSNSCVFQAGTLMGEEGVGKGVSYPGPRERGWWAELGPHYIVMGRGASSVDFCPRPGQSGPVSQLYM